MKNTISYTVAGAMLLLAVPVMAEDMEKSTNSTADGKVMTMNAEQAVQNWKAKPKEVAMAMVEKYGQPDEVTAERLIWHNNGPWLKSELVNEEIPHDFPVAHKDMLKQTIAMKVPATKFSDLAEYDGSVIVERTKGTVSARCDKEEMNFLAVNLAKDVVDGKKSVEEAREAYAMIAMKFMKGDKDPYTQGLEFKPEQSAAGDPDEPAKMSEE